MPADMPTDVPDNQWANPRWVDLVHRWRWPIILAGFVVYGFIPADSPKWLPALVFFTSILGFWIRDVVDSIQWKRANRARSAASPLDVRDWDRARVVVRFRSGR